ncbi:MAG TPA: protease modulator HflC [Gammaproteobacteria bacterium]|nr:protease modulator HflC [Gammaproteobacteria bacterium]
MSMRVNLLLVAAVLLAVLIRMSVFAVDEREHVVKLQLQKIVNADFTPGLHFKIPFADDVVRYTKSIQARERRDENVQTADRKNLVVESLIVWRILDPAQYYRSVNGGDEEVAIQSLSAIVGGGLQAVVSQRTMPEVLSSSSADLLADALTAVRTRAPDFGVQIVDLRIKRISMADESTVFERMKKERQRVATGLRAEGDEQVARIKADADRQRTVILAEAYRDGERIRGAGDARAAEIYAAAYSKDRDFFSFYRSLQAYRKSIGRDQDVLVLKPDGDFFQFLHRQAGTAAH